LECGGLIGAMSELLEGLYINVNSEVWAKASCLGSVGPKGQKLGCSGSAMVHHKFKEAKKQDVPDHQVPILPYYITLLHNAPVPKTCQLFSF
jgi:hypothetical protein